MFLSFQANHSQSIRLCAQLFYFVSLFLVELVLVSPPGLTSICLSPGSQHGSCHENRGRAQSSCRLGSSSVICGGNGYLEKCLWDFLRLGICSFRCPGASESTGGVGIMKMKPKTSWTQIFTLGQGGAWPTRGNRGHARWDLVGSLTMYNGLFHFQLRSFMSMKLWEDGPFSLQRNGFEEILWSKGFVTQDVDSPSPRLLSIHLRGCISHCCLKDPAHRAEQILGV